MITLKSLELKTGKHDSVEHGMCVMEAVSYFAGEPFSDRPECACPVLTQYMITLNDNMDTEERKLLKPYIKKLIGTRDGNSQKRVDILAWASIVEFTPHCLRLIGLNKEADSLIHLKEYDWSAASYAASSAAWSARSAASSASSAAWSVSSAASSASYAASYAASSAASSAAWSASSASSAASSAAWSAESAASYAASSASSSERKKVLKLALKALDRALAVK